MRSRLPAAIKSKPEPMTRALIACRRRTAPRKATLTASGNCKIESGFLRWNPLRAASAQRARNFLADAVGELAQHEHLAAPQFERTLAADEVQEQSQRHGHDVCGSI